MWTALLAEYGLLAAQLPSADPARVERPRRRLREREGAIPRHATTLGTTSV